ncbi:hypothetical protein CR970_03705 [Candidatus Saccharibacteria bacterium]|nr:MAG: hypothetical protein CR970_03705 [Candidatus Saccharibacteria bacterium]
MSRALQQRAADHFAAADPLIYELMMLHGPYTVQPHTQYYQQLLRAIIGQQLSVKAAATIERRLVGLFGDRFPAPEEVAATDAQQLRAIGMSGAKVRYGQDLAQRICDGRLDLSGLAGLPAGDLGLRSGMQRLYGLRELPNPSRCREIARQRGWHPYASLATWYVWKYLDNTPSGGTEVADGGA